MSSATSNELDKLETKIKELEVSLRSARASISTHSWYHGSDDEEDAEDRDRGRPNRRVRAEIEAFNTRVDELEKLRAQLTELKQKGK